MDNYYQKLEIYEKELNDWIEKHGELDDLEDLHWQLSSIMIIESFSTDYWKNSVLHYKSSKFLASSFSVEQLLQLTLLSAKKDLVGALLAASGIIVDGDYPGLAYGVLRLASTLVVRLRVNTFGSDYCFYCWFSGSP